MSHEVLSHALSLASGGEPVALVTLVSTSASTPREVGAKMLVRGDGSIDGTIGGGRLEALAIEQALEVHQTGLARLEDLSLLDLDMECGGKVRVFIELLTVPPRLLLFGGGHVAREVSIIATRLGLAVHVVDDREEWANPTRFPEAAATLAVPFLDGLAQLGVRSTDRVVIVTRGHAHDQEVLQAVVDRGALYLGMIGSKRKVLLALKALEEAGVSPEALAAIHAPIGLDLGGDSPAEIAVAVSAEMIAAVHGKEEARSLSAGRRASR
ncbi:MAG: XdhC family protein [Deltaproteobacteria bacterium]|nr:XdhC family protein [Deltaproteobacteria bacterium]